MTRISIIASGKPNPHATRTANQIVIERGHGLHKPQTQTCLQVLLTIVTLVMVATSVMAMVFYVSLLTQQCDTGDRAPTTTTATASTPQYGGNRTAMTYGERYESWIEAPEPDDNGKTPFSFDDMYNATLKPRSLQGQWVGDDEVVYLNDKLELVLHDVKLDSKQVIMPNDTFITYRPNSYQLSPDRWYVLITYELVTEVQDPYSFAKHKIYDRRTGRLLAFPNDDTMKDQIVMYNTWTPLGSGLSFVFDDDMYYQRDPYSKPERLTTSGTTHKIRNGISFWNYRGVLQSGSSMWWSPDMTKLVYGEFNSTEVVMSEHPVYGQRVYPEMFRHVYLKAGDAAHFSYSKLYVIDMTDPARSRKVLSPPKEFKDKEHYFYKVLWRDSKTFAVGWTDRIQKKSLIDFCDANTLSCKRNHELEVKNGWFRGPHLIMFINGGSHYLAVLAKEVKGQGRYRQVVMISSEDGSETFLTDGTKEVYGIDSFDWKRSLVYYSGTNGNQLERHVFRVGTPLAQADLRAPKCLTCDEGTDCGYASASFSWSSDYYVLACLGPAVPTYTLKYMHDASQSFVLNDNSNVKAALSTRRLPTREFHEINVGDGYTGWAEFILPPGMVKDGSVKYPVIFYPYAGPHGHTQGNYRYKASSAPGGLWDYFLASSQDIIVVRLNGRGSGGRGDDYLFQLYRQLGTKEITDQIDGARSIREKFPFVDGDRMAIWGWSYGGYTSTHAIGHPSDVFKCGIAVAPVINYRHYYAAYTERYMDLDTQEDNAAGYDLTDATRKAENFRNKKYMIAHGTLDDNVHLQMAMEMISALSKAQVPFKSQLYVDQNHSIRDYYQNRHLFMSMTDFYLNDCLKRQPSQGE